MSFSDNGISLTWDMLSTFGSQTLDHVAELFGMDFLTQQKKKDRRTQVYQKIAEFMNSHFRADGCFYSS
jgi:hypothetical protein